MSPESVFLHISGLGSCLHHSSLHDFSFPPPLHTQVISEGHVSRVGSLPIDHFMPRRGVVCDALCDASIVAPVLLHAACPEISLHNGGPPEDRHPAAFASV